MDAILGLPPTLPPHEPAALRQFQAHVTGLAVMGRSLLAAVGEPGQEIERGALYVTTTGVWWDSSSS
jgi:hypothetical protein